MTSEQALQYLMDRIPPPERPDTVIGNTLSSTLGPSVTLPDDYRLFLDVYGPGWFTEPSQTAQSGQYPTLRVFDLVSPSLHQHVKIGEATHEVAEVLLRTAAESHESYPGIPEMFPPAYPAVPGVLPWADFDQGDVFYWWVDGPANSWRVCADDRSWVSHYDYSLLEFLAINLTSLPGNKFFDDGEERFVGFMPSSKYDDFARDYFRGPAP